jgi:hypothetical protein
VRMLRPRPLTAGAALILIVLMVAVVAAGCGSPASGVKTYTDADYHYSFEYPAGWEVQKGDNAEVTAGGSAAASMAAYDPDGAVADDTYIDLVQVSVYKLNTNIDESMMSDIQPEVEQVLASLESQGTDMKTVEALSETTVDGMPGFKVTYSFSKSGTPANSTLYFLFSGDVEYQLTVQAATENWEAKAAAFDALVASFKPGPTD